MSWSGVKKQSIKSEIEAWCDEMGIENYTINSQGEIDVDGSIFFGNNNLDNKFKELPYKFGKVNGSFSLEGCKNLTSLKNCPDEISINNMFDIDNCINLDSLEGCPKKVGGNFWCRNCKVQFTPFDIKKVCNVDGIVMYM